MTCKEFIPELGKFEEESGTENTLWISKNDGHSEVVDRSGNRPCSFTEFNKTEDSVSGLGTLQVFRNGTTCCLYDGTVTTRSFKRRKS